MDLGFTRQVVCRFGSFCVVLADGQNSILIDLSDLKVSRSTTVVAAAQWAVEVGDNLVFGEN